MEPMHKMTRHARDRFTARNIPPMVAEMIITHGHSCSAGDGARKYALTKKSMSEIRRTWGREIAEAVSVYRSRNIYVVASNGRLITAAFSSHPLFR